MAMKVGAFLAFVSLLLSVPSPLQATSLSEDPLRATTGAHVFNEFMQLDADDSRLLHAGIDVATDGTPEVFLPVPAGKTCEFIAGDANGLFFLANKRQNGNYVLFLAHHITPYSFIVGESYSSVYPLGTVSGDHLHVGIWVSPDAEIWDESGDLCNPRKFALENAPWIADDIRPVLDDCFFYAGPPNIWTVTVHDTNPQDPSYFNSIYAMSLFIDDTEVDHFEFAWMLSKNGTYPPDAQEFYPCTTCFPVGRNDPNVLKYRMTWPPTPGRHVWRLKWWDGMGNHDEGTPGDQPSASLAEIGGRVCDGNAVLTWRIESVHAVRSFDVETSTLQDRDYRMVNETPILALAGKVDYEFLARLPDNWETVWYRVIASEWGGARYLLGQMSLAAPAPIISHSAVHPNPAKGQVTIEVEISREDEGRLDVFNAAGRRVRNLVAGKLSPGRQMYTWDGRDDTGHAMPSGSYMLRFETRESPELLVRKVTLVR